MENAEANAFEWHNLGFVMNLDFATLDSLRRNHPAWRLLRADHAPLIVAFLWRVFVKPNVRTMPEANLAEALEDELFALNERYGPETYPRRARDYLNDWAANSQGWLRKFYPQGSDEAHFDLTPAAERAIAWLDTLSARSFVGTESRLLTLFELLRQIVEGSETDPQIRITELRKRQHEIEVEIARIQAGDIPLLDGTSVRDRFQQFASTARELLSDFREVEHNFRNLDRQVRENVMFWEGSKGELLDQILGQRDAIADSDQGRSFRAFWDFLMSQSRQDELSNLLNKALRLPAIAESNPDHRLRRVHYDWLDAGEHTQRTVAQLSHQLRRFIDDRAYLENRRIMELLHRIEVHAVALRHTQPGREFMEMDEMNACIELPMERPLHSSTQKRRINSGIIETGEAALELDSLFSYVAIDKARLKGNIRKELQDHAQVTLRALIHAHPLEHGLAELVTYLQLAADDTKAVFDEAHLETVLWQDTQGAWKSAGLPRVIFVR